jgi:hypothetical protein
MTVSRLAREDVTELMREANQRVERQAFESALRLVEMCDDLDEAKRLLRRRLDRLTK